MSIFSSIAIWIRVARLRTLPLSLSGIVIGSSAAYAVSSFDTTIFVLAVLTTISFQVLSNFANDYGDGVKGTDNKDRLGPQRGIQSGQIKPHTLRMAIWINSFISMLLTLLLVFVAFRSNFHSTLFFIVLGVLAIASAIFYTVGSKSYGYKGYGDVFVFVFFGLVSVIGSNYLFVKTIDFLLFLPATAVGMFSVAVLHLNNMRDVINDTNFGKNTLAVRLGTRKSNAYHVFLILIPMILTLVYAYLSSSPYCYLIILFLGMSLFGHLKRVLNRHSDMELDPELKKIAILTFLYACLVGVLINL